MKKTLFAFAALAFATAPALAMECCKQGAECCKQHKECCDHDKGNPEPKPKSEHAH